MPYAETKSHQKTSEDHMTKEKRLHLCLIVVAAILGIAFYEESWTTKTLMMLPVFIIYLLYYVVNLLTDIRDELRLLSEKLNERK